MSAGAVLAAAAGAALAILMAAALRSRRLDPLRGRTPAPRDMPGLSAPDLRPSATAPAHPVPDRPQALSSPLAILAIQVSGLDSVEERFGEVTGQRALREVLHTVRHTLRTGDACERWNARRLVAILPGMDADRAAGIALRLQRAVSSLTLITHSGQEIQLGVVVGKASGPGDGRTLDELRDAAHRDLERVTGGSTENGESEPGTGERLRRALPMSPN